mmetsp:Transcript_51332/g.166432  ORF Transcript_51332/g.166432 Transcript_51332/m.166432 type:complete len:443 (+) Transcript_51332:71-1399(+)
MRRFGLLAGAAAAALALSLVAASAPAMASAAAAPSSEDAAPLLALPPIPMEDDSAGLSALAPAEAKLLPLSLHVRVADDVCEPMIRRGAELPAKATKLFTTTQDSQAAAHIEIYVGERSFCRGNLFLGVMELAPLPTPSYRSFVQLEVSVEVDESGAVVCRTAEVEGRALGEPYCTAEIAGDLLSAGGSAPEAGREGREVAVFSHALAKHLPVLLAVRSVRLFNGRDIVIRQHQRRQEEKVGTGGVLWESAIVLADYVGRNKTKFAWQGKRVLELGAGTGLVTIALAMEGADVVLTDGNPKVVEGAGRNVEGAGRLSGSVRLETFDWNSPEDLARMQALGPWDAIVGSDLVYPGNAGRKCVASNETTHPADETLLRLFGQLAGPATQVLLALKDRTGEVGRFVELASNPTRGWQLEHALSEDIMPEFRSIPAVAVLRLVRIT